MPRGGRRANSGRKGLAFEDKQYAARRMRELIREHQPIRERRAFARLVRGRTKPDDETFYDELIGHYEDLADLSRISPEKRSKMSVPEVLAYRAKARAQFASQYRADPTSSPIHSFFKDVKLTRVLTIPGPTKVELGTFHQQIADELASKLGRPISRLQVANAIRWMAAFDSFD